MCHVQQTTKQWIKRLDTLVDVLNVCWVNNPSQYLTVINARSPWDVKVLKQNKHQCRTRHCSRVVRNQSLSKTNSNRNVLITFNYIVLRGSAMSVIVRDNCMSRSASTLRSSLKMIAVQLVCCAAETTCVELYKPSTCWTTLILLNEPVIVEKFPGWHTLYLSSETPDSSTHPNTSTTTSWSHRAGY